MTLWPWPLTLESCHVMPLGWSIPVPSLNWIRLTVPELGRLQLFIDRQLKVPTFYFFDGKAGQISNFILLTPKSITVTRTTYNDVLSVGLGICPKMRPMAPVKKQRKKRSCVKLAICPDNPRRCTSPLKFCMWSRVREVVIYLKFQENRLWGLGAVGGGRKSPSPTDLDHVIYSTTPCTTVQAVIVATRC